MKQNFEVLGLIGETGSDLLSRSLTFVSDSVIVIQFNNLTSTKSGCMDLIKECLSSPAETIILHGAELALPIDLIDFKSIKDLASENKKKLILLYSYIQPENVWILSELDQGLLGQTSDEREFMYSFRKALKPGQFIDLKGGCQHIGKASLDSLPSNLLVSP